MLSLRDAVDSNEAIHRRHRGKRCSDLKGFWIPRRLDILPGDIWTSDDTTPIWGWWVPWPHAQGNPDFDKASCEFKFGVKLLQGQLLPLMDVASNYIFSAALIARETAAYRASDIWALFGRAFDQVGLPRLGFQLERGSWEANLIRGEAVEIEKSGLTLERRVGGLRMLPTTVTAWHREKLGEHFNFPKGLQTWTSYLPKSKPIEAAFDRMQTLEGTLWGSLGRDQMRNPYEKTKKIYQACRRGALDPRLHFLSGTELTKRLTGLYDYVNNEPMEGRVFKGVPRQLWQDGLHRHPLVHLGDSQSYLFRRSWDVCHITRGWAEVRFTDLQGNKQIEKYQNPMHFPALEGRTVCVYFDAYDHTAPAQIHDAETREFLCMADHFVPPGMFMDSSRHGHDQRRIYNAALTTLYMSLSEEAPSRQLPPEIAQRRVEAAAAVRSALPETITAMPRTRPPENPLRSRSDAEVQRHNTGIARTLAALGNREAAPVEISG